MCAGSSEWTSMTFQGAEIERNDLGLKRKMFRYAGKSSF